MELEKGIFESFPNTSYRFTLNADSKRYINLTQPVNFSLFHEK